MQIVAALTTPIVDNTEEGAERIRVRGIVQGVGFRPAIWHLARRHGLRGSVWNDAQGVDIHVCGQQAGIDAFVLALTREAPPLARVDHVERTAAARLPPGATFRITSSRDSPADGAHLINVAPDAAVCAECLKEVFDPFARRFRYPFTNCTHCGPRLSIIETVPYDRGSTTMRHFAMCAACSAEYDNPEDRRFHAQPIACPACGPRAWLERGQGATRDAALPAEQDAAAVACALLQRGHIVAVKGLGGFQLACDACDERAVEQLRQRKRRPGKPFALMVRDLEVARRFATVHAADEILLSDPSGPIVIVDAVARRRVASGVAPGVATLGLMLPNTPLHHLMLQGMDRPIVLTSGNLSDEPLCITNDDARARLGCIAEYFLFHDRGIARRVDDSVQRVVAGCPRMLRRARGHAPASLALPAGFASAPPVLALGGELKNSFCLLQASSGQGTAIVSHHMGDLENALTYADYRLSIDQYLHLFRHTPRIIAVDLHPEYLSGKLGRDVADQLGLELTHVQHHHAHAAACMAEHGVALGESPVLAVVLDGLGYGEDGALWGGEFLLADYRVCERLGTFRPVAMLGGAQAMREPWRNSYAHLATGMGWTRFTQSHGQLELHRFLDSKPRRLLDGMIAGNVNCPLTSSCGRLFDAVAAAAGVCRDRVLYEGQAAIEFEALVDLNTLHDEDDARAYPFAIGLIAISGLPCIDPLPMWHALLDDLAHATAVSVIAARFHKGLSIAIVQMVEKLRHETRRKNPVTTIALSGGVFQNRVLLEQVLMRLKPLGLRVLTPSHIPSNDGGLALGQAVIAAAQCIAAY